MDHAAQEYTHAAPMPRLTPALLFLLACPAIAQPNARSDEAQYSAYVELLGNTAFVSLNADVVYDSGYGFRIGGFADPSPLFACDDNDFHCRSRRDRDEEPNATVYLLVMGHRLVGASAHKLELGLGVLVGHSDGGITNFLPRAALTATVGYRIQPEVGSLGFRVGLAPIVAPDRVLLRPGVSVSFGLPTPR
jgi:hypothetical protein